jgi:hypothetical protein
LVVSPSCIYTDTSAGVEGDRKKVAMFTTLPNRACSSCNQSLVPLNRARTCAIKSSMGGAESSCRAIKSSDPSRGAPVGAQAPLRAGKRAHSGAMGDPQFLLGARLGKRGRKNKEKRRETVAVLCRQRSSTPSSAGRRPWCSTSVATGRETQGGGDRMRR